MPLEAIKQEHIDYKPIERYEKNGRLKDMYSYHKPVTDNKATKPVVSIKDIKKPSFITENLLEINKHIKVSEKILMLKYNWDDDGAKPVNQLVYYRAIKFLESYSNFIYSELGKILIAPDIAPVNDGSIDLEWTLKNSSFLINFKNSKEEVAFYYGEFKENENIVFDTNGQINTETIQNKFAFYLSYLSEEINN